MDEEEVKIDPFIGVFDIHFSGPRKTLAENVRIVHWKMSTNADVFYLIDDCGCLYNFHNINMMIRTGD